MKKKVLTVIFVVFYCTTYAQYSQDILTPIKTPNNETIEAWQRVEFSASDLAQTEAYAASWIQDHSSKAVRVAPASRTYNCHDYAWHYSDGGTKRWINQKNQSGGVNLSKYWSGTTPTYQLTIAKSNKSILL